jgi:hypothetical protein
MSCTVQQAAHSLITANKGEPEKALQKKSDLTVGNLGGCTSRIFGLGSRDLLIARFTINARPGARLRGRTALAPGCAGPANEEPLTTHHSPCPTHSTDATHRRGVVTAHTAHSYHSCHTDHTTPLAANIAHTAHSTHSAPTTCLA